VTPKEANEAHLVQAETCDELVLSPSAGYRATAEAIFSIEFSEGRSALRFRNSSTIAVAT
jgi:hypothetical protein